MKKIGLPIGPEVPVDGGGSLHLAPPLAGDAAQLEASAGHGLGVRVHLCAGGVTPAHCEQNRDGGRTLRQVLTPCRDKVRKGSEKPAGLTKQAAEQTDEKQGG